MSRRRSASAYAQRYHTALQEHPDAVLAHRAVTNVLKGAPSLAGERFTDSACASRSLLGAGVLACGHHPVDHLEQLDGLDRLGDVAVHVGVEAALPIAFHRVRGERHDGDAVPVCRSRARIVAVASKPSISGICRSIRTRSTPRAAAPRSPRGRWSPSTACGRALEQVLGELAVDALSSATSTRSFLAARFGVTDGAAGCASRELRAPSAARIVSSRAACPTGLTTQRTSGMAAALRASCERSADVRMMTGADEHRGCLRSAAVRSSAVGARHLHVDDARWRTHCLRDRPLATAAIPSLASTTLHAAMAEYLAHDTKIGRVVVDDERRETRELLEPAAPGPRAAWRFRESTTPNWNVLPRPGVLSTQMRPPISSTSCAQIVRPSPVPPNLRVVEPSRLRERLEDGRLLVGARCRCRCRSRVKCSPTPVVAARLAARRGRRSRRAR